MKSESVSLYDLAVERVEKLSGYHVIVLKGDADPGIEIFTYEDTLDFEKDFTILPSGISHKHSDDNRVIYLGMDETEEDFDKDDYATYCDDGFYVIHNGLLIS